MDCSVSSYARDKGDQHASAINVGKSDVQGYQNGRIQVVLLTQCDIQEAESIKTELPPLYPPGAI